MLPPRRRPLAGTAGTTGNSATGRPVAVARRRRVAAADARSGRGARTGRPVRRDQPGGNLEFKTLGIGSLWPRGAAPGRSASLADVGGLGRRTRTGGGGTDRRRVRGTCYSGAALDADRTGSADRGRTVVRQCGHRAPAHGRGRRHAQHRPVRRDSPRRLRTLRIAARSPASRIPRRLPQGTPSRRQSGHAADHCRYGLRAV